MEKNLRMTGTLIGSLLFALALGGCAPLSSSVDKHPKNQTGDAHPGPTFDHTGPLPTSIDLASKDNTNLSDTEDGSALFFKIASLKDSDEKKLPNAEKELSDEEIQSLIRKGSTRIENPLAEEDHTPYLVFLLKLDPSSPLLDPKQQKNIERLLSVKKSSDKKLVLRLASPRDIAKDYEDRLTLGALRLAFVQRLRAIRIYSLDRISTRTKRGAAEVLNDDRLVTDGDDDHSEKEPTESKD